MNNLPSPWQQFYHSNFRYRPLGVGLGSYIRDVNGEVTGIRFERLYKTNKAKWAKQ